LLNNPICASFVSALMYAASGTSDTLVSPTIMGVYDKLNKSGTVRFVEGGLGKYGGLFTPPAGPIRIGGVRAILPGATTEHVELLTKNTAIYYSQVALGETLHAAGRSFDDRVLAEAASKITGIKGLPDDPTDRDANSKYFHHKVLGVKCR
jgi:hypothetical protein